MDFVLLGDDTLTQWALIAGGVAIAGLFLYLYLDAQRLRKNGVSLRAWIVQANDALYSPGGDDTPRRPAADVESYSLKFSDRTGGGSAVAA